MSRKKKPGHGDPNKVPADYAHAITTAMKAAGSDVAQFEDAFNKFQHHYGMTPEEAVAAGHSNEELKKIGKRRTWGRSHVFWDRVEAEREQIRRGVAEYIAEHNLPPLTPEEKNRTWALNLFIAAQKGLYINGKNYAQFMDAFGREPDTCSTMSEADLRDLRTRHSEARIETRRTTSAEITNAARVVRRTKRVRGLRLRGDALEYP